MTTSFFMNLSLPTPRVSTSWGSTINTAITTIDSHNHSSNSGQRITSAGLLIDASLSMSSNSVTSINSYNYTNQASASGSNNSILVHDGNLYIIDGSGNIIQFTSGGSIAITASIGQIKGDYSSTGAVVSYIDSTLSYLMKDSIGSNADIYLKNLSGTTLSATSISTSSISGTALTTITNNISATSTFSGATTLSGNTTGRGIIPVGGVVAYASNLSGVSIPSSMLELNGQTISDSSSPLNGVTLPDISNSVFLMGSSTSGISSGNNSYTLLETNLPSHSHTINHGHSNTFALANTTIPTSTHTHNIAHIHMYSKTPSGATPYGLSTQSSADDSVTTFTSSNTRLFPSSTTSNLVDFLGGSQKISFLENFANDTWYTTGVLSPPTGSAGSTASSDVPDITNTIGITGSIADYSGSSGSTGSGTSISLLPNYISTKFLIRYK